MFPEGIKANALWLNIVQKRKEVWCSAVRMGHFPGKWSSGDKHNSGVTAYPQNQGLKATHSLGSTDLQILQASLKKNSPHKFIMQEDGCKHKISNSY